MLVVLLSLFVADSVLFFIENMTPAATGTKAIATPRVRAGSVNEIDLASLNLFGSQQSNLAPEVIDAPETKLNLELQGVFAADNEQHSTAIVAQKNKPGELVYIGDTLPGNAVLVAVFDDHILLKRGSRMEKLMFSDHYSLPKVSRSSGVTKANPTTSSRLQRVRERIAQRGGISKPAIRPANSPGSSLRNYLKSNKDKINQDPRGILSQLGVSPVTEGEAKGYKLDGSVSTPALMRAGLQQGDTILSVNGRPVGDAMNDVAMIDKAMASKRVRVEVQRGSRRFFLTVPIP